MVKDTWSNGLKWNTYRTTVGRMREVGVWGEYCERYPKHDKDRDPIPDDVDVLLDKDRDADLVEKVRE